MWYMDGSYKLAPRLLHKYTSFILSLELLLSLVYALRNGKSQSVSEAFLMSVLNKCTDSGNHLYPISTTTITNF